jgi:hypothetical protein
MGRIDLLDVVIVEMVSAVAVVDAQAAAYAGGEKRKRGGDDRECYRAGYLNVSNETIEQMLMLKD